MELTRHGMIAHGDYNLKFTQDGTWMVSRHGTVIGYADTLDTVPALIESAREAVRKRLADVQARAEARLQKEKDEASEVARATKRG